MAIDRAAPIYTGRDPELKQIAEYENYLREQIVHELELVRREIKTIKATAAATVAVASVETEGTEDNGV